MGSACWNNITELYHLGVFLQLHKLIWGLVIVYMRLFGG